MTGERIFLITLGVVMLCAACVAIIDGAFSERTKRWIDRRMIRWWLRRTKRDRRRKKTLRIVMDPSAGYRGGVPRIEEEP